MLFFLRQSFAITRVQLLCLEHVVRVARHFRCLLLDIGMFPNGFWAESGALFQLTTWHVVVYHGLILMMNQMKKCWTFLDCIEQFVVPCIATILLPCKKHSPQNLSWWVQWVDLWCLFGNGDGNRDTISARCRYVFLGSPSRSGMSWNPNGNTQVWSSVSLLPGQCGARLVNQMHVSFVHWHHDTQGVAEVDDFPCAWLACFQWASPWEGLRPSLEICVFVF